MDFSPRLESRQKTIWIVDIVEVCCPLIKLPLSLLKKLHHTEFRDSVIFDAFLVDSKVVCAKVSCMFVSFLTNSGKKL